MRIGIFDSGLGGLITLRAIAAHLPQYDYIYFGDTKHVPYGNRSQQEIYQLTEHAVRFLCEQGCALILLACNTASAEALRKIQQEFLPREYPDRRVLGVIIPTAEAALLPKTKRIGVIGTTATIHSSAYVRELQKLRPEIGVAQQATPLLVPMIERDGLRWVKPVLTQYLAPLLAQKIDTLILGCTHYALARHVAQGIVGKKIRVISQDELIPQKLSAYLERHPEIRIQLSQNGQHLFYATAVHEQLISKIHEWFGEDVEPQEV